MAQGEGLARRAAGAAELCRGDGAGGANAGQGWGSRGYDAGKKTKGRKRHILTDTDGNLVHVVFHAADIQGRDDAPLVPAEMIKACPVAALCLRRWWLCR